MSDYIGQCKAQITMDSDSIVLHFKSFLIYECAIQDIPDALGGTWYSYITKRIYPLLITLYENVDLIRTRYVKITQESS